MSYNGEGSSGTLFLEGATPKLKWATVIFLNKANIKQHVFDNCLYLNPNNEKLAPYGFPTRATRLSCYDISKAGQGESGLGFYFGGPGGVGCDGL